jgi:hypothetical protein
VHDAVRHRRGLAGDPLDHIAAQARERGAVARRPRDREPRGRHDDGHGAARVAGRKRRRLREVAALQHRVEHRPVERAQLREQSTVEVHMRS